MSCVRVRFPLQSGFMCSCVCVSFSRTTRQSIAWEPVCTWYVFLFLFHCLCVCFFSPTELTFFLHSAVLFFFSRVDASIYIYFSVYTVYIYIYAYTSVYIPSVCMRRARCEEGGRTCRLWFGVSPTLNTACDRFCMVLSLSISFSISRARASVYPSVVFLATAAETKKSTPRVFASTYLCRGRVRLRL